MKSAYLGLWGPYPGLGPQIGQIGPFIGEIGHFGLYLAYLGLSGAQGPQIGQIGPFIGVYRQNRPFWAIFGPFWAKMAYLGLYPGIGPYTGQIGHFGPYLGPLFDPFWAILGQKRGKTSYWPERGLPEGVPNMAQKWSFWAISGTPYFEGPQPYGYGAWGFGPYTGQNGSKRGPKMAYFGSYLGPPLGGASNLMVTGLGDLAQKWSKRAQKGVPK